MSQAGGRVEESQGQNRYRIIKFFKNSLDEGMGKRVETRVISGGAKLRSYGCQSACKNARIFVRFKD